MRDKRGNRRTRVVARVALVTAMAGAGLVAVGTPALAADAISLPVTRGPSGGTNTIQITTAATDFTATSAVTFSATACATPLANWANVGLTASTTSPFAPTAGLVTTPAANVKWSSGAAKTLEVVVPSELRLVGTQQTTASYYVCVYNDDANAATLTHNSTTAVYTISAGLTTLNTYVGPNRGGNTLTATSVGGTALASAHAVQFQAVTGASLWTPCATTYQTAATPTASGAPPYNTTAGIVAATSVFTAAAGAVPARMTITVPSGLALAGSQTVARYNVCIYAGTAANSSVLISQTGIPYEVVPGVLTSNATRGPSGGNNSIVLTTTATTTGTFVQDAVTVQFQYAGMGTASTCSPIYQADANVSALAGVGDAPPDQVAGAKTAPSADVRVLAPDRLAVTVPSGVALDSSPAQITAKYHICAYSGTNTSTSTLIGATDSGTPYTIGTAATITGVTPTAGSAQGGTRVTVYGSDFPADLADADVLIGGVAVADVVVAADGKSFTATAEPHSVGGPFAISVMTAGGLTTRAGLFTYSNGITIAPNTAPTSRVTGLNVSVQGVDLDTLAFSATTGTTPNSANPHVYLVDGVYNPATATTGIKTNHQVAECLNALVVAPDELICTLFPAGNGTNAQPVAFQCDDCTVADDTNLMVSAGDAPFRKEMVGMMVSGGTGGPLPPGTTIVSVTDSSNAVLSNPVTTAALDSTTTDVDITPARTVTDGITVGTTTLESANVDFVAGDVGRSVVGPGIPPGTTIQSVTDQDTAILTAAATTNTTGVRITIGAQPIPVGTYTLTVVNNGAIGSVPTLSKTVISSRSTFTVADY
jgi:hypothetical protein